MSEPPEIITTPVEGQAGSSMFQESWSFLEDVKVGRSPQPRLDCYLLPLLVAGFFVLQLDHSNISNALTDTITEDLGITNNDLMFAGVVIAEIPSNLILRRGTIALTQSWCTNTHSFLATRFLIGAFEGGYIPGGQYMLALFYTREELASRTAIFYLDNYAATATGSLIAAGVMNMGGTGGLSGWQWLSAVEEIITLVVFLALVAFLPRSPGHTAPIHGLFDFFSPRERQILRARIMADDKTKGADKAQITLKTLAYALTYYSLWLHMLLNVVALAPKGGLQLHGPKIIKSLGFSRTNANLLNAVSSVLVIVLSCTISFASDRTHWRGPWCIVVFSWSIIFAGVLYGLPTGSDKWAHYAIFTLLSGGNALAQGLDDAWVSINAVNPSKRSIDLVMVVMGSSLGAIVGNQLFRDDDAPKYARAFCHFTR
ncbi:major facilitator superfamily domain-containing protein [Colletotrichum navitas]|uniref:Major facilitator superfamily domain-containing protein n=1 Tax=Colletotrichum navitas TaxID=681940 RepID=A0AAD8UZJ4_9PEZI|nr:major facilitator superfamily domain-containing protein [Colletotrichum navitas]KAK1573717.1 major facilitator superfamily domain-containing protein [Colletotrichum navitas]